MKLFKDCFAPPPSTQQSKPIQAVYADEDGSHNPDVAKTTPLTQRLLMGDLIKAGYKTNPYDEKGRYVGAPLPVNERERLDTLRFLKVLDTPPEPDLDEITALANEMFQVPIVLVSLVDSKRQWFKSKVGLDATETCREDSFCAWTLLPNKPKVLLVEDTWVDPLFKDNPLVTGPPYIRAYCGAPLITDNKLVLGTLCLIDTKPMTMNAYQLDSLYVLADSATSCIMKAQKADTAVQNISQMQMENRQLIWGIDSNDEGFVLLEVNKDKFDHRIVYTNKGWEQLTGFTAEDSWDKQITMLFPEIEDQVVIEGSFYSISSKSADQLSRSQDPVAILSGLLEAMYSFKAFEATMQATSQKKGQFWARIRICPVPQDEEATVEQETRKVFVQLLDVTDHQESLAALKAIYEQLQSSKLSHEHAIAAKTRFLHNMSHEIRNPLSVVVGCSDLLEDALKHSHPDQKQLVSTVQQASAQLCALINNVLDFNNITTEKLEVVEIEFDLMKCLDACMDIQRHNIAKANSAYELTYWVGKTVPKVLLGDSTRLCQVISNLLTNACKFTERGEIELTVDILDESRVIPAGAIRPKRLIAHAQKQKLKERETIKLFVEVRDTGIGFPEGSAEWMFQPFSQGDQSRTRKYGGTGLGLVISQHLVECMGGELWVVSTAGKGSTFSFYVVLEPVRDKAVKMPKSLPASPTCRANDVFLSIFQRGAPMVRSKPASPLAREVGLFSPLHPQDVVLPTKSISCCYYVVSASELFQRSVTLLLNRIDVLQVVNVETSQALSALVTDLEAFAKSQSGQVSQLMLRSIIVIVDEDKMPCRSLSEARFTLNLFQESQCVVRVGMVSSYPLSHESNKIVVMHKPITYGELLWLNEVSGMVAPLHMAERQSERESSIGSSGEAPHVLVVEDSYTNHMVFNKILNKLGMFNVDVAYNGLDSIEMVEKNDYSVIFMDLHMPVMDGMTAVRLMKEKFGDNVPRVVAVTADVVSEAEKECEEIGMVDFVSKPISKKRIREVLVKLGFSAFLR